MIYQLADVQNSAQMHVLITPFLQKIVTAPTVGPGQNYAQYLTCNASTNS